MAGMTFAEIGQELGISDVAAGKIYARALLKLQIAAGLVPAPTGRKTSSNQMLWVRNWQLRNRERVAAYKKGRKRNYKQEWERRKNNERARSL